MCAYAYVRVCGYAHVRVCGYAHVSVCGCAHVRVYVRVQRDVSQVCNNKNNSLCVPEHLENARTGEHNHKHRRSEVGRPSGGQIWNVSRIVWLKFADNSSCLIHPISIYGI